jgi:hypothetical protein
MQMYNQSNNAGKVEMNYNKPLVPLRRALTTKIKNIINKRDTKRKRNKSNNSGKLIKRER